MHNHIPIAGEKYAKSIEQHVLCVLTTVLYCHFRSGPHSWVP